MKKFELTDEAKEFEGRTLHRIRALRDFSDVKKGDLGGWVESEDNLSQIGYCWIYGDYSINRSVDITGPDSYLCFTNVGSENGTLTAYYCSHMGIIHCERGCFSGTLKEFEEAVYEGHGYNKYAKEYGILINFIKLRFDKGSS